MREIVLKRPVVRNKGLDALAACPRTDCLFMLVQLPFSEVRFYFPTPSLRPRLPSIDFANDLRGAVGHHIRIGDTRHRNTDITILRRILSLEYPGIAAKPGAPDIDN